MKRLQRTTIKLPKPLWQKAKIAGLREGRTLADLIVSALAAYLRRGDGTRP